MGSYHLFELDGDLFRVELVKGDTWKDCSKDKVQRLNTENDGWVDSDVSASRLRSFGRSVTIFEVPIQN